MEEDIAFGPENMGSAEEIEERITRALEATGMSEYREHSPNATFRWTKTKKSPISGVLSIETECIIFDEPTAMIDPEGRKEVLKAIYRSNRLKHITII